MVLAPGVRASSLGAVATSFGWALSIVLLVFTLRLVLLKPAIAQIRSMRKMQKFAPEMKKIQKKYANDKQRQAQEMQKLQREHGVNPLGGCLPMLLQIPVFIGLNHVLRSFREPRTTELYFFKRARRPVVPGREPVRRAPRRRGVRHRLARWHARLALGGRAGRRSR